MKSFDKTKNDNTTSRKKKTVLVSVGLFLVTYAIHMFVGIQMKVPHISTDEVGAIASAAFIVGEDWSGIVSQMSYYGYGASLLYIPIFLLVKSPILRYQLMIALNCAYLSLIPVMALFIQQKFLKTNLKDAAFTALAVGLYPGYLVYTKWAWYEAMLCFLPWLVLLIVLTLCNKDKNRSKVFMSCLLAFLLVYGYAVHGRGLGFIVAVAMLILLILIFERRMLIEPISFVITFVSCYLMYKNHYNYLLKNLWLLENGKVLHNTLGGILQSAGDIFSYQMINSFFKVVLGQFFSGMAATYGLLSIGIVMSLICLVKWMKNKNRRDDIDTERNITIIILLQLLFFLVAFGISTFALRGSAYDANARGDYVIYLRYFSNVLGLVVFVVLIFFQRNKIKYKMIISSTILFSVSLLPIQMLAKIVASRNSTANIPILNILPYIGKNPESYVEHINFLKLVLVIGFVFVVILVLLNKVKKTSVICVLLCGVFIHSYLYTSYNMILKCTETDYSYVEAPMDVLNDVEDLNNNYNQVYYYNVKQVKPWSGSALQFVLPEYKVKEFNYIIDNSTQEEQICDFITNNSIIISTEDIKLEDTLDNVYRIEDSRLITDNEYIWVYGNDIYEYIKNNSDLEFIQKE